MARDLDPIQLTQTDKQLSRIRQGVALMGAIAVACVFLKAWILLPFAAAFCLALVLGLVRKPYLRMDREGLHIHSSYAAHRDLSWYDITQFEIKARNIVFFVRGSKRPQSFRAAWFGMAATPLLAQLETFHRRYRSEKPAGRD
ncbi:MAG: hypothetical protein U0Q15_11510 [Kineosporiaceae bacterium]